MMFVDVPSTQLLDFLEPGIKEQMKALMANEKKKVVIDRLEWTDTGIRVWILTEK